MVTKALILLYLILFPLGQLLGFFIQQNFNLPFRIHFTDILVLSVASLTLFKHVTKRKPFPEWVKKSSLFVGFGVLIALIAPSFLAVNHSIETFLYPLRLIGYFLFIYSVSESGLSEKFFTKSLLIVSVLSATLGWVQYLLAPDLTSMKLYGWDDHYFRMTGAFLDPSFLGIILVLSILLSVWKKLPFLSIFLTISLAFTFSRASWLALFAGLAWFVVKKIEMKHSLVIAIVLIFTIPFLPRPGGEGVNLQRTNSIEQKAVNYVESYKIIEKSPLLGVGLNNICNIKHSLGFNTSTNSCHGLDNSFLFIFASTGLVGIFLFFNSVVEIFMNIDKKWVTLFFASGVSIFFHSMFTHTLFYPWVMGWVAILFSLTRKKSWSV